MKHLTMARLYELCCREGEPPPEDAAHLRACARCRSLCEAMTREEEPRAFEAVEFCERQGDIYLLALGELNLFRVRGALTHLEDCPRCGELLRFLEDRGPAVAGRIRAQRTAVSFGKYRRLLEQGAQLVEPDYRMAVAATLGGGDRIIPAEGVLRNGKKFHIEYGREQGVLTVEYFADPATGEAPSVRLIVQDHSDRLGWSDILPRENPERLVLRFNANELNIIHIGVVNQMIEAFPYIVLLGGDVDERK